MTLVGPTRAYPFVETAGIVAHVIGPVALRIGETPITLDDSRRCRLLVARLLVAEGRPVPATRLAGDLWPDLSPERARACVHTTVSRLRATFRAHQAGDPLRRWGDSYGFASDQEIWVDLTEFRHELACARNALGTARPFDAKSGFQRAIVLSHGPLMANETSFDWIDAERRVFAREVSGARTRLMELHLDSGAPDAAALLALTSLKDEPADERASQLLITAYLALDQRRLALQEYWRLNDVLARELDASPAGATWALVRHLDRG